MTMSGVTLRKLEGWRLATVGHVDPSANKEACGTGCGSVMLNHAMLRTWGKAPAVPKHCGQQRWMATQPLLAAALPVTPWARARLVPPAPRRVVGCAAARGSTRPPGGLSWVGLVMGAWVVHGRASLGEPKWKPKAGFVDNECDVSPGLW